MLRGNEEKYSASKHATAYRRPKSHSKKKSKHSAADVNTSSNTPDDLGSVVGNKQTGAGGYVGGGGNTTPTFYDEIVLQRSTQIIPCFKFAKSLISHQTGQDLVWQFADGLHTILDEIVNEIPNPAHVRIHPIGHNPANIANVNIGIGGKLMHAALPHLPTGIGGFAANLGINLGMLSPPPPPPNPANTTKKKRRPFISPYKYAPVINGQSNNVGAVPPQLAQPYGSGGGAPVLANNYAPQWNSGSLGPVLANNYAPQWNSGSLYAPGNINNLGSYSANPVGTGFPNNVGAVPPQLAQPYGSGGGAPVLANNYAPQYGGNSGSLYAPNNNPGYISQPNGFGNAAYIPLVPHQYGAPSNNVPSPSSNVVLKYVAPLNLPSNDAETTTNAKSKNDNDW